MNIPVWNLSHSVPRPCPQTELPVCILVAVDVLGSNECMLHTCSCIGVLSQDSGGHSIGLAELQLQMC